MKFNLFLFFFNALLCLEPILGNVEKIEDKSTIPFGADRVAKINNINNRVSNNPDILSGKVLSDAPQSTDNEYPPSRFALVEKHRCKMGKCKPGYILGHFDDPSEIKRNGKKNIRKGKTNKLFDS